jgi:N-acetylglucosamine kinase-like BadF-type ATPase
MTVQTAYLAIETGGSKGRVALSMGSVTAARTVMMSLNPNDTGPAVFRRRLMTLLSPLLSPLPSTHGRGTTRIRGLAAIAGAGRPQTLALCERGLKAILGRFSGDVRIAVMNDADALLHACLGGRKGRQKGIVIIAGTGSICLGVYRESGRRITARFGGWGSFRDEGSGSRLGLEVLDAVLRYPEGRPGARMLADLLTRRYGIGPREARRQFAPAGIDRTARRDSVAGLARIALDAYALGDRYSRRLVRRSVGDLVDMVAAVNGRVRLNRNGKVFASGGLFSSPIVRRLFASGIRRRLPGAQLTIVEDSLLLMLGAAAG